MIKKPEKGLRSTANGRKAAPWTLPRLKVPPRRILIFGGSAVALIILILWNFALAPRKEAPTQAAVSAVSPGSSAPEQPTVSSPGLLDANQDDSDDLPVIQAIRFQPPLPTGTDTLKAEVITAAPDPSRLTYTYVWKVNDRIVEGAVRNTLNLSTFKKRDLVTVTVTPYDGDRAGLPLESPVVAIHSIPPSLDLNAPHQTRKAGEPMEFQLVSLHPDSNEATFSLEAPLVPGLSIDSHTGKITWIIQPNQKGTIRFGAAVEDSDKTKVTKIFEIKVE